MAAFTLAGLSALVGAPNASAADDYPANLRNPPRDSVRDPWGRLNRECASFVAWRASQAGVPLPRQVTGPNGKTVIMEFGREWADTAASIGFVVDVTPTVGSIAAWRANEGVGDLGHVAWVTAVNTNFTVSVEEYNFREDGTYDQRHNIRAPHYIHLDPAWEPNGGRSLTRMAGSSRITTATETSLHSYPDAGTAHAVVLSRSDSFADALAGTPLAVAKGAPVLLTPSDALDPSTETEIRRALEPGGRVYLLGGTSALGPAVEQRVKALGFEVVRFSGTNRYGTAVDIATRGLDAPATVLLADGQTFVPALLAGPASAKLGGAAVLLTKGSALPSETAAYLTAHPSKRFAIGDNAAKAVPAAAAVLGSNPAALSVAVAKMFFKNPEAVAITGFETFADALSGGAHAGARAAPLLLTSPTAVSGEIDAFLRAQQPTVRQAYVYGGSGVVNDDAFLALHYLLRVAPTAAILCPSCT